MRISAYIAGGAVAALALFSGPTSNSVLQFTPAAEAAASVSISVFYDGLSNDGSWVNHRGSYVFIPANVKKGWRPYTDGHWVYTEDFGWTWVSNERFGWATYHYGRWGYGDDIGWYWVPGTRWAPAWVSWRRSNDHVVWAPLPPSRGDDVSINISVGDVPDFYWVAVPTRNFLDVDLRVRLVDRDRDRIIRRTEFIGTPRVRNNIVVNTVIDVNVIERETGRKVKRVRAKETDNPRDARASDDQVTVFRGEVKRDEGTKPARVQKETEVRKIRRDGSQDGKANAEDEATSPNNTSADDGASDAQNKKRNAESNAPSDTNANSEGDAQQNTKKADDNNSQPSDAATNKRKRPAASGQQDDVSTGSTDAPASQKAGDNNSSRSNKENAQGQKKKPTSQADQGNRKKAGQDQKQQDKKNAGKKKQKCDPDTDANCNQ